MWQSPNQRVGALQNAKMRQRARLKRPLHIRRVRAEARLVFNKETQATAEMTGVVGEPIEVRVVLNDLSLSGIGLYAQERMLPGHTIRLTLEDPRKITVEGRIVWCNDEHIGSPVISANPYNFRIGIRFCFSTKAEEDAFKLFCADLKTSLLTADTQP